MNYPEEHKTVMVTFLGKVKKNCYGGLKDEIVTKKGFYSKSDGYYDRKNNWIPTPNGIFHIPQKWGNFTWSDGTTSEVPEGFYGQKVLPENVKTWHDI
jgi:hypothetical protein